MGKIKDFIAKWRLGGRHGKSWEQVFLRGGPYPGTDSKVTQEYKNHPIVYQAVHLKANSVSSTPFNFTVNDNPVTDQPINKLFEKPNPYMTQNDMFQAISIWLDLAGEAFIWMNKSVGQELGRTGALPAELWILNPGLMKEVVDDKTKLLSGWVYNNTMPLTIEETIQFRLYNPYSQWRGLAPLDAARLAIDTDYAAATFAEGFFENDATPGGVLSLPTSVEDGPLSKAEYRKIIRQWEQRHKGADKRKRIALLQMGMTYTPIEVDYQSMQFQEQRGYSRELILATFGVPVTMLYAEGINRATAEQHAKNYWQNTILPRFKTIEDAFYHSMFVPLGTATGTFELESIAELQEDINTQSQTADTLWRMGVPFDRINERLDMGFVTDWEGADDPYISATLVQPNQPQPVTSTASVEVEETKTVEVAPPVQSHEDVIQKLGRKLSRYFFEQRSQVLKGDEISWDAEMQRLVQLVSPVFTEVYGDQKALLQRKMQKIGSLNDALQRRLEDEELDDDEIKEIYNNATRRAKVLARHEIETALLEVAAARN